MYTLIQGLTAIIFVIFTSWYGAKYKISKLKSFIIGLVYLIIYIILVKFLGWAATGFKYLGPENAVKSYLFLPFFVFLISKISNIKFIKLLDMLAAPSVMAYGLGHLACIFAGCCHGFSYYEGTFLFNLSMFLTGTNKLPIQLGESITALIIFAIVYYLGERKKHSANGILFCTWYILFGIERFLWEFLRDNKKLILFSEFDSCGGFFGISELALWALSMLIIGIILLYYIKKKEKKELEKIMN